jgi:recombination protein RecT
MSAVSLRDLQKIQPEDVKRLPVAQQMEGISRLLAQQVKQIGSVIASHLTPEKMARIALNELRTNDNLFKIAAQNPQSFVNAVLQASHLGLEIGGALGQAYLVPFKGEVKMMPGYRGLISIARRSGEITSINAEVVYENDKFDLTLGIDPRVDHKPMLKGDRGRPALVYMVAKFKDGGHHFEWMTIEEVEKIKSRSSAVASGKKTPWDTDFDEMVKKTVVRRGWKYMPMSIEMQKAVMIEAANDNGQGIVIDGDSVLVTPAVESVDTSTGEVTRNDAPALGLPDAIAAARNGDVETAQDISRELNERDRAEVEKHIQQQAAPVEQQYAPRQRRAHNIE